MMPAKHSSIVAPPRVFVLILILLLLPIAPVQAATITVNSTCSLANAITAANTDTATGGCQAGSGADTITLTANITLSAALPNIASNITIEGAGKSISGNNTYHIFHIASGPVTINNLTLTKGKARNRPDTTYADWDGGAIHAVFGSEALTINKSRFIDNFVPGAQCANGTGGAIFALGNALTIRDSVFRGNRASTSPGFYAGNATITELRRSSFTGHAHADDATTACKSYSTAVINLQHTATISNVTVSGNSATGISVFGGTTSIYHSTIVDNKNPVHGLSGGLKQTMLSSTSRGRVNLYNSIIADNLNHNCVGDEDLNVWLTANVNNLIKARIVETEENGEIVRTEVIDCNPALSGDPMLASYRGAPGYHPFWQGSPAIDVGASAHCPSTDIRGISRPHGDACDLGSYEGFISPPLAIEDDDDEDLHTADAPGTPCVYCAELIASGLRLKARNGFNSGVQFRRVDGGAIGDQSLLAAGFIDAVDVYGWVEQGVGVCFPQSGRLLFLDAAFSPRAQVPLDGYTQGGMTCADFDRPGTVLLLPGPAPIRTAPAQQATTARATPVSGCMVTTLGLLRFRDAPGGAPLRYTDPWGRQENGWLPSTVTLTALERTADWFKVDYYGTRGWVSAHHVTPQGTCA